MAVIGCLGDVVFTVSERTVKTINNWKWSGSARWTTHQRHLNNALTENTGIDPDKITFEIMLSGEYGVNPYTELVKLWNYERNGTPIPLTIGSHGYGKYRWSLISHSTEITSTTRKGSKKALLVLTERRTRMGIVILVPDHTSASVVNAINGLERRFGKLFYKMFKSITVDNGSEFQDFEGIEIAHRRRGKRTVVFFCHPYSAYERGSNENMNRLLRRFFPKGTNFDNVTPAQVRAAEEWINNYPRKLLGWKSAAELFRRELEAA